MDNFQMVGKLLAAYFGDFGFVEGIQDIKESIERSPKFKQNWTRFVTIIRNRQLEPGQPLKLVNYRANQVLDENTDEEAYVWLDKMIQNVERKDGRIEPY